MDHWLQPGPRAAAASIAMLVGCALLLQFALNVVERGRDPITEIGLLYGWFTIWSNTAVALIAGHAAVTGRARGPSHPALLAASMVWIVVVGVIYNTLLANLNHPPTFLRQLIDMVFHVVSPLAWLLWWLWGRPRGALDWRQLGAVLPLPMAYCAVSLGLGGQTGRYPYFFVDVSLLGWGQVLINIVGLAALFAGLMAAAIAWDRMRGARSLSKG